VLGLTGAAGGSLAASPPAGGDDVVRLQIPTDGNVATLRRVLRELDEAAVDIVDLAVHTPALANVFLALTGHMDRPSPRGQAEEVL
jgi:hypothetical protein